VPRICARIVHPPTPARRVETMSGAVGARNNAFANDSQDPTCFTSYASSSHSLRQPETNNDVPSSRSESRWVPPAARVHLQALQNCEPEHVEIALTLAREGKLEHIRALQNFPASVVMRWWKSLMVHEGTPEHIIFVNSARLGPSMKGEFTE
jgi:hypothetical protein